MCFHGDERYVKDKVIVKPSFGYFTIHTLDSFSEKMVRLNIFLIFIKNLFDLTGLLIINIKLLLHQKDL